MSFVTSASEGFLRLMCFACSCAYALRVILWALWPFGIRARWLYPYCVGDSDVRGGAIGADEGVIKAVVYELPRMVTSFAFEGCADVEWEPASSYFVELGFVEFDGFGRGACVFRRDVLGHGLLLRSGHAYPDCQLIMPGVATWCVVGWRCKASARTRGVKSEERCVGKRYTIGRSLVSLWRESARAGRLLLSTRLRG